MRTTNGPSDDLNTHSVNTTNDTRHVSEISTHVTQSQADFLDLVRSHGYQELSQSLKLIHDLALYHTDIPFDKAQKSALFDLKVLWEGFERIK